MRATSTTGHLVRWASVVLAATTAVVLAGGTAVWALERHAPRSNLRHWGDCVWWAITTLTTVGYGEHFPVTLAGRLVAVVVMLSGVTIIGAVAAIVAFGFAGRLAQRLEDAVLQVESQVESVGAEVEQVEEALARGALREVRVAVADAETGASLTWLLARLGWHPDADGSGLRWRQGAVRLEVAVRGAPPSPAAPGQLTFAAGSAERTTRIARESLRHGFLRLTDEDDVPALLRTTSGFEVTLLPA